VVLFSLQSSFGNKHREVSVVDSLSLELIIEVSLDLLPDEVSSGSKDVAPWNIVVVDHLRLSDDFLVPFREIGFFRV
jgi:hypothetical protein